MAQPYHPDIPPWPHLHEDIDQSFSEWNLYNFNHLLYPLRLATTTRRYRYLPKVSGIQTIQTYFRPAAQRAKFYGQEKVGPYSWISKNYKYNKRSRKNKPLWKRRKRHQ